MREFIKRIAAEDSVKVFGIVIKLHSPDRYVIEDRLGRRFHAESSTTYSPGQYVTVVEKRIVGKAAIFASPETINV